MIVALPISTWSVTEGPNSPEFSKFSSVNVDGMVNEFTGTFNYSIPVVTIPGPEGSGYSLSLSYTSGNSPEAEASWVGYGWTLNPGAIVREKRGYPDDYYDKEVTVYNKTRPLKNYSSTTAIFPEIFSFESGTSIGINIGLNYNNQSGYGWEFGFKSDLLGIANLNIGIDNRNVFSWDASPSLQLYQSWLENLGHKSILETKHFKITLNESDQMKYLASSFNQMLSIGQHINYYYGEEISPCISSEYNGTTTTYFVGLNTNAFPLFGIEGSGSYSNSEQNTIEEKSYKTYGFMYSFYAYGDPSSKMDYYREMDYPFNVRNYFLPIPFSNPDNFVVNAEGLSGSFRAYTRFAQNFRPNKTTSKTDIFLLGAEVHELKSFGIGGGIDFGGGKQVFKEGDWGVDKTGFEFRNKEYTDEEVFFKFINDPGGQLDFRPNKGQSINDYSTDFSKIAKIDGEMKVKINAQKILNTAHGGRIGRSSYIGYNTYEQFTKKNSERFVAYDPSNKRSNNNDPKLISEFQIVNTNGVNYNFGIPVFSQNEQEINFGLYPIKHIKTDVLSSNLCKINNGIDINSYESKCSIYNNYNENGILKGTLRNSPYANTFLLTSITTPDYVDINFDGPTPDDLGGWTKFSYKQAYGSETGDWYKWRMPYQGLIVNKGSYSDPSDDLGSYSSGEKEVYYLKEIRTKTHVAFFITNKTVDDKAIWIEYPDGSPKELKGTNTEREDGIRSHYDELKATSGEGISNIENKLEYLERIEVYALDPNYDPKNDVFYKVTEKSQTTYFQYNYESWPGIPNNKSGNGKLTLKKVWFDYGEVTEPKVNAYEFQYKYDNNREFPTEYSTEGSKHDIKSNWTQYFDSDQTPQYYYGCADAWNSYRNDGGERFNNKTPWVNQLFDPTFDPASWQLKQIKLPTGGEILIQYEQNTYSYVQNRQATVMANIKMDEDNQKIQYDQYGKLYVDINSIGIAIADLDEYVLELREYFKTNQLYFKFLFDLGDNAENTAVTDPRHGYNNCKSEYIEGYVKIENVERVGNDIILGISGEDKLPTIKCQEFYKTKRYGVIDDNCGSCNCYRKDESPFTAVVGPISGVLASSCNELYDESSFIRLPCFKKKRGGGIRVKRLLMYDSFNTIAENDNQPNLYGTEYVYEDIDGFSFGVATNEPGLLEKENALYQSLKGRENQTWYQKITAGEELMQFEGPLGRSLLPGPSIGYSKIVIKNIYSGLTGTGFKELEFYTCKDKPFDSTITIDAKGINCISNSDINKKTSRHIIPLGLLNLIKEKIWATQGFQFITHNYHGKPKFIRTFGGNKENATDWESSSIEYIYYEPGSLVPTISSAWGADASSLQSPGIDMEVISETREITDAIRNFRIAPDIFVGFSLPPLFVFSAISGGLSFTDNELRYNVINKIIRCPVLLKSVITKKNGIESENINIAFDSRTGQPVITAISDEYDKMYLADENSQHKGKILNFDQKAAGKYLLMGQRSQNEGFNLFDGKLRIDATSQQPDGIPFCYLDLFYDNNFWNCGSINIFTEGDVLQLTPRFSGPGNIDAEYYRVYKKSGNMLTIKPIKIDQDYFPGNTQKYVDIKIIRSGYTNQLNASCGNITTYANVDNNNLPGISAYETGINYPEIAQRNAFLSELNQKANSLLIVNWDPTEEEWSSQGANSAVIDVSGFSHLKLYNQHGQLINLEDCLITLNRTKDVTYDTYQTTTNPPESKEVVQPIYIELCISRSSPLEAQSPDMGILETDLASDLNECLDMAWSMRLDQEFPEYNWFSDNDDVITRKLNDNALTKKIFERSGLAKVYNTYYSIDNDIKKGDQIIDYDNADMEIFYVADDEKAYIAKYQLTFNDDVGDNWFGFARHFNENGDPPWNGHDNGEIWYDDLADLYANDITIIETKTAKADFFDFINITSFTSQIAAFQDNSNQLELITHTSDHINWEDIFNISPVQILEDFCCIEYSVCPGVTDIFQFTSDYKITQKGLWNHSIERWDAAQNPVATLTNYPLVNDNTGWENWLYHCHMCKDVSNLDPGHENMPFPDPGANHWCATCACIEFPQLHMDYVRGQVVSANAIEFSDEWEYDNNTYYKNEYINDFINGREDYTLGKKGKWRPKKHWVFNINVSQDQTKAWWSPISGMPEFNWHEETHIDTDYWVNTEKIISYTPSGKPTETQNILGIKFTAKYDHNFVMPAIITNNSDFENCGFESFEYQTTDKYDNIDADQLVNDAHTGRYALKMDADELVFHIKNISKTTDLEGLDIAFWYKTIEEGNEGIDSFTISVVAGSSSNDVNIQDIAQVGDWHLVYGFCPPENLSVDSHVDIKISANPDEVLIDDFKYVPSKSSSNCYVYDINNLNILAEFDDAHFGLIYQYNDKGQLIRKQVETMRGMKTLSEAYYNNPKIDRPSEIIVAGQSQGAVIDDIQLPQTEINIDHGSGQHSLNKRSMIQDQFERRNPELFKKDDAEIKNKFGIFNFQYDENGQKMEFFDIDKDSVVTGFESTIDTLKNSVDQDPGITPNIQMPSSSDFEQIKIQKDMKNEMDIKYVQPKILTPEMELPEIERNSLDSLKNSIRHEYQIKSDSLSKERIREFDDIKIKNK
ncbi:MAG: hypothetical protein ACOCWM_01195, partial [Cyclobacteriaceae bacterium]